MLLVLESMFYAQSYYCSWNIYVPFVTKNRISLQFVVVRMDKVIALNT